MYICYIDNKHIHSYFTITFGRYQSLNKVASFLNTQIVEAVEAVLRGDLVEGLRHLKVGRKTIKLLSIQSMKSIYYLNILFLELMGILLFWYVKMGVYINMHLSSHNLSFLLSSSMSKHT